jgi:hypothetical protein
MSKSGNMTVMEREQLSRAIRMRARVAKSELKARGLKELADFEAHIQAEYHYNEDAVWKAAMEKAQPVIDEAQRMIAERARELGIPARFAPTLSANWWGKATAKDERSELRRLAGSRIDAMVAHGIVAIETEEAKLQVELISGAIESIEGQAFLSRIPSPEELIPALGMGDLKKLLTAVTKEEDARAHPWRYRLEQEASGGGHD